MSSTFVGEHMIRFPYTVESKTTVREAFYLMEEWRIRHLPVVDSGKVVGIVSDRDLRQYFTSSGDTRVRDFMIVTPYCVRIGTSLEKVLETMDNQKIGSAIVVGADNSVLGIFTTTDAVRLLRRFLKEDPSSEFARWGVEDAFERWEEVSA